MTKRILFVFTSANRTLTGANTVSHYGGSHPWLANQPPNRVSNQGWYLPEAAHPYYILAPHFTIDFTSPEGPNPPVDEYSVQVSLPC